MAQFWGLRSLAHNFINNSVGVRGVPMLARNAVSQWLAASVLLIQAAAAQAPPGTALPDPAPARIESAEAVKDLLSRGASIGYILVNVDVDTRSTIALRHLRGNEYVRGDGTKFRDLTDLAQDAQFSYSPAIPLVKAPLVKGHKWEHSGTVNEKSGIGASRIDCTFVVLGPASIETPAGRFDAVEILETREFGGNALTAHRFVDPATGIVLKEVWKTDRVRIRAMGAGVGGDVTMRRTNTDLTLTRLPSL